VGHHGTVTGPPLSEFRLVGLHAGELSHTVRGPGGHWSAFEPLSTPLGAGTIRAVSCAGSAKACTLWQSVTMGRRPASGTRYAVGRHLAGKFRQRQRSRPGPGLQRCGLRRCRQRPTCRRGRGRPALAHDPPVRGWQTNFVNLRCPSDDGAGPVTAIGCAGVGGSLHVVVVIDGGLWHSVRNANGTWQRRSAGQSARGRRRLPRVRLRGICRCAPRPRHWKFRSKSNLWHSIRKPDGSWRPVRQYQDPGVTHVRRRRLRRGLRDLQLSHSRPVGSGTPSGARTEPGSLAAI
jgi:hypothetical protein